MRVVVDEEQCKGHSICWGLCPEVFQINSWGFAEVQVDEVPAELEDKVRTAIKQCPERAISEV